MFNSNWISAKVLTTVAVVLFLGGCSGGSSNPPPPPPPPPNQVPTADAGPDQSTNEGTPVTLDGSGSTDSDGTISTYAWTQTAGTTVTLDETAPVMPTFDAPSVVADEVLTFDLQVTDNEGATSGTDSVSITVRNVNAPPVADAGPDQIVDSNEVVTLDGSASADSDGTLDVYTWTQTTGNAVTLDETVPAMPTFTAPNVGGDEILTFELQVTDNEGAMSAVDSVVITINPLLALPFTDNFADGNSDGWTEFDDSTTNASAWSAASGAYVQTSWTNNFGGDVVESYRRGSYSLLADSVNLTNYRYVVDVSPGFASADDIGVMFRYVDNDNYYRLSLSSLAGYARLESKINGVFVTLAHSFRGYKIEPQQIIVEVEGPLIQVFVGGNPLFAANDSDHPAGGVALYSRDGVSFDNVSITINSADPEIVIATPAADTVTPDGPRNIAVTAIARNIPAAGSVELEFIGDTACGAVTESSPGVFEAQCANRAVGDYEVRATLLDNGIEVDRDSNRSVAIGASGVGDRYDAIGDSLTLGFHDKYRSDNVNLTERRTISFQGWAGPLSDMLTTTKGAPNLVGNEAIPGDRIGQTRFERMPSILERNSGPRSNRALLLSGTNDSNNFQPLADGLGTINPADPLSCGNPTATYNCHMRWLINDLGLAGRDTIYIGILPPVWADELTGAPYADPLDPSSTRNQRIISYNKVITDELALLPGVVLGPDLFSCFLTATENRFSMFEDVLHPNGLGYALMGALWHDAITGVPAVPGVCSMPAGFYVLGSLDPYVHGHKQNLLETGDEFYTDSTATLSSIPTELVDGIWVSQANADSGNTDASFLNFDAGAAPVTVYIAYDSTGGPPTSATHGFAPAALTGNLVTSNGTPFSIVEAVGVTGAVSIGGTMSDLSGVAREGYIVIVVAP